MSNANLRGGSSGGALSPGYVTGQYYAMALYGINNTSGTNAAATDNTDLVMFYVSESITIDRIAFNITNAGAGGTECRVGIYNCVNGRPATVHTTFGTVATDSTGVKVITGTASLDAGYYYAALQSESFPIYTAYGTSLPSPPFMELGTSFTTNDLRALRYSGTTYASGLADLSAATPASTLDDAVIFQMRIA